MTVPKDLAAIRPLTVGPKSPRDFVGTFLPWVQRCRTVSDQTVDHRSSTLEGS